LCFEPELLFGVDALAFFRGEFHGLIVMSPSA
jgi:hypothetical protein